jgi:hypothetical protein
MFIFTPVAVISTSAAIQRAAAKSDALRSGTVSISRWTDV